MSCYARGGIEEQKVGSRLNHGRIAVPTTNRGEQETTASSSSFDCVAEIN